MKTIPVICTTVHKGVFYGYAPKKAVDAVNGSATTIRIEKARMCVYWSADVKSVLGLAANGPSSGCKVGPAVPAITLRDVTSVMEVSTEAAAKWESGPWN